MFGRRFRGARASLVLVMALLLAACGGAAEQPAATSKTSAASSAAPSSASATSSATSAASTGSASTSSAVMSSAAPGSASGSSVASSGAAGKDIPVALVVPLSGPWARQGELVRMGAEMAVDEINQQGGVKALGGAKIVLKVADAGDTPEKAKSAAQRLISQEPGLVAGIGAWLSSFTLAITEVSEREQLPWLTLSYADTITSRGYKFVFQTSPTAGTQSRETIPIVLQMAEAATGKKPTKVSVITDNTASPMAFIKPMREGGFAKLGLQVVSDDTFTPPLSDATPLIQKLRNARPDFAFVNATTTADTKLIMEKVSEFGLGKGKLPLVSNGAQNDTPELLKALGPDLLEGYLSSIANYPGKNQQALVERFKKRTNEPWLTQDSMSAYGEVWIIKEGLEKAGAADRVKLGDAIHSLDISSGPAAEAFADGKVKFDAAGHRLTTTIPIIQWQKGVPVMVYPKEIAVADPIWPKQ